MSKFIKTLIIINGIMFPILIGFILIKNFYKSKEPVNEPEGVIVGKRLERAKKDSLGLQGITFSAPDYIYNSTNYYISISTLTYEEAKDFRNAVASSNNMSYGFAQVANILFIDEDYQVIGTLLDQKASIADMKVQRGYGDEIDTTAKYIAYEIGFKDSNKDDLLNFEDEHDLYLSDHDGKNLVQVTNNIDVGYYRFMKRNSQIMIHYTERDSIREEYKKLRFAIYDISTRDFKPLDALHHKLDEIENSFFQ